MSHEFTDDFRDLNTSYLVLLRRVAAASLAQAETRFGISREEAERVRDMSMGDIQALASSGLLEFQARPLLTDLLDPKLPAAGKAGAVLRSISAR